MNNHLADNLISQINNVQIQKDKQLLISDADEVLLHFLPAFEDYLNEHGYWYDLKSYALFGNIKQYYTPSFLSFHNSNAMFNKIVVSKKV